VSRQNKRPSDSRCQSLGRFSRPDALEEIRELDPQRLRQPFDAVDADVALTALDRADVGAIQAGTLRQGSLGETARLPLAPQVGGEQFAGGYLGAGFLHATNLRPAAGTSITFRWHLAAGGEELRPLLRPRITVRPAPPPSSPDRKTDDVVRLRVTG
jgi:hypothetical protein